MEEGVFKTLVPILKKEGFDFVFLYNFGEPFLHPLVSNFIDLLRANKITVDVASKLSCKRDWPRFLKS